MYDFVIYNRLESRVNGSASYLVHQRRVIAITTSYNPLQCEMNSNTCTGVTLARRMPSAIASLSISHFSELNAIWCCYNNNLLCCTNWQACPLSIPSNVTYVPISQKVTWCCLPGYIYLLFICIWWYVRMNMHGKFVLIINRFCLSRLLKSRFVNKCLILKCVFSRDSMKHLISRII